MATQFFDLGDVIGYVAPIGDCWAWMFMRGGAILAAGVEKKRDDALKLMKPREPSI